VRTFHFPLEGEGRLIDSFGLNAPSPAPRLTSPRERGEGASTRPVRKR